MQEKNKILKERALQLAQSIETKTLCEADCSSMINFILAKRSYCLDASFAKEILTIDALVAIPGTSEVVAGIINLRGHILTIIHLNAVLNIDLGEEEPMHVLILEDKSAGIEFGVLVNQVVNTLTINHEDIQSLPGNQNAKTRTLLSGVSAHGHTVINTQQLINHIYKQQTSNFL